MGVDQVAKNPPVNSWREWDKRPQGGSTRDTARHSVQRTRLPYFPRRRLLAQVVSAIHKATSPHLSGSFRIHLGTGHKRGHTWGIHAAWGVVDGMPNRKCASLLTHASIMRSLFGGASHGSECGLLDRNGKRQDMTRRGDPYKVREWFPLCPSQKNFHAAYPKFRIGGD